MRISPTNTVLLLLTGLIGASATSAVLVYSPQDEAVHLARAEVDRDLANNEALVRALREDLTAPAPVASLAGTSLEVTAAQQKAEEQLIDTMEGAFDDEGVNTLRERARVKSGELQEHADALKARLAKKQEEALRYTQPSLNDAVQIAKEQERQAQQGQQQKDMQRVRGEIFKRFSDVFGLSPDERQNIGGRLQRITEGLDPQEIRRQVEAGEITQEEARLKGEQAMREFASTMGDVVTPERSEAMRSGMQDQLNNVFGADNAPQVPDVSQLPTPDQLIPQGGQPGQGVDPGQAGRIFDPRQLFGGRQGQTSTPTDIPQNLPQDIPRNLPQGVAPGAIPIPQEELDKARKQKPSGWDDF